MFFGRKKEPENSFDKRLVDFVTPEMLDDTPKIEATTPEVEVTSPSPEITTPSLEVATPNIGATSPSLEITTPNIEATSPSLDAPTSEVESDTSKIVLAPPQVEVARPLVEGAYLNGDLEIKRILGRGPINLYLADAGDWGSADLKLVAQRSAPSGVALAPSETPLFPVATRFVQDGCEYAVWPFEPLHAFSNWQAAPNDEAFLSAIRAFAAGFAVLETENLAMFAPMESLFMDEAGEIRFFGFFDGAEVGLAPSAGPSDETSATGLEEGASPALRLLQALSSKVARENLAARTTLRLDDEFGALPLAVETKDFAQNLSNGEFKNCAEVLMALEALQSSAKWETALAIDVGLERELNEDSGLVLRLHRAGELGNAKLDLLVVADGMGGHEGGEVASKATIDALQTAIFSRLTLDWNDNALVLKTLRTVAEEVNSAVVAMNENPPFAGLKHKPGSTLCFAVRVGSRLFVVNVGDSRAYRWNAQTGLSALSKDHSYVQDLIDQGRLKEEEAWGHPDGNVILSHIGMPRGMLCDVYLHLLQMGDRIVLVSDGVVDTMRDSEIEATIAGAGNAESLAQKLVENSNAGGGTDNITVAVLWGE